MLILIWFHRENIPVEEILYVASSENLGQVSQRWICLSLISITTLLPSDSAMNEITQDKGEVFWESALWEGFHLFYWRSSIFLLDKYVKNSKTS